MRIGLCYDLAADWAHEARDAEASAEFDQPETIAAIESVLAARGHDVERIGRAQALVRRLAAGARWDLVFNICEGLRGAGRESLVPALLEAYGVPYVFSDPEVLALSLHKAHGKRVVRDAGVPTADFRVLHDPAQRCDLDLPVFVKPLSEGTGKGITGSSLCRTAEQVAQAVARIVQRFAQPALVESWLPGREFTVGIIGEGATAETIGIVEVCAEAAYGFDLKKNYEFVTYSAVPETQAHAIGHDGRPRVTYRLATDKEAHAAGAVALGAWRALGARDGGRVDIRSDAAGRPMFLEANPLAGLHPTDSDLTIAARLAGHDYDWLVGRIMDAACARLGLCWR
jgi:D-alanine-D-alanine ligase